MTIIDFPRGGRSTVGSHPTHRFRSVAPPVGSAPTGAWLIAYEELAACCAEVAAGPPVRVYDADWEELVDWIRSRLAILDSLKAEAQGGAS